MEIRGIMPASIRAYGYDLVIIHRWMKGCQKTLVDLKTADLLSFIEEQKKKRIHPKSINRRLTTCRSIYRFTYQKEIPTGLGVSLPSPYYRGPGKDRELGLFGIPKRQQLQLSVKVPKTLIEPLKEARVNYFLKDISSYRNLSIVLLMLLCGLRSCEVLSLKIEWLDLSSLQIRVRGKGGRERVLPLPEALIPSIKKYLKLERPVQCSTDSVFVVLKGSRTGDPLTPAGLRSLFRYRRKISGITEAHPHRFRHSFGHNMAVAHVPLPILQKMMGHACHTTTLQYIHFSIDDIREEYYKAMENLQKRYAHAKF